MRSIRYQSIADSLRERVRVSEPGSVLPSESELSKEFEASRVTVRKSLELLRDEGLIDSRQGFGWSVAKPPVPQRLGTLNTIEAQLADRGVRAERRVLEFAFTTAPPRVAGLLDDEQVLRVKRLNLADGEPFAVVTVFCPAELGQHLSRRDVERTPFYELLGLRLRGATQRIGAASAAPSEAELLGIPVGSPVLRCERITTDTAGRPVLVSEHVFPAQRTEFVVDMPTAAPSIAPDGVRLVDGTESDDPV